MNANLRGDVKVKGMSIEDFIKKTVSSTPKSSDTEVVDKKKFEIDIDAIVAKKMQSLDAFQDEKKILSNSITVLQERITKLETAVTATTKDPPVDFKPDIDALSASIDKLEKRMADMKPKRGVDQGTLDTAVLEITKIIDSKIEKVSMELNQLRKELEE